MNEVTELLGDEVIGDQASHSERSEETAFGAGSMPNQYPMVQFDHIRLRKSKRMKNRVPLTMLSLVLSCFLAAPWAAGRQEKGTTLSGEEFFIISSSDTTKDQLVLKRPTEVTELMLLTPKTTCLDEHGKSFPCKGLRAGDTVFVVSSRGSGGVRAAARIRFGPMTGAEVHRRYMTFH